VLVDPTLEDGLERRLVVALLVFFACGWAWSVLPGKALAATSASTAVRVTLPAIKKRLMRPSLRSAASRALTVRV
jgi:hypothetical protein